MRRSSLASALSGELMAHEEDYIELLISSERLLLMTSKISELDDGLE